jgi:hypothetical protein
MRRTYELARVVVFTAFLALALACGSNDTPQASPPCNQNPWLCPAGQTCWAADGVPNFVCLASGASKLGEACEPRAGTATCGDGLLCLQLVGNASGQCRAFCDPMGSGHGCAAGEACRAAALNSNLNVLFHVCVGSSVPDAGAPDAPTSD